VAVKQSAPCWASHWAHAAQLPVLASQLTLPPVPAVPPLPATPPVPPLPPPQPYPVLPAQLFEQV
jgi:hypothetical protein